MKHDAEARVDYANAGTTSGIGGGFPFLRGTREKVVVAGRAGLVEELVATAPVDTDGRRREERSRLAAQRCEGLGEQRRAPHPALADLCFLGGGPALGDRFAGEVNDRVE